MRPTRRDRDLVLLDAEPRRGCSRVKALEPRQLPIVASAAAGARRPRSRRRRARDRRASRCAGASAARPGAAERMGEATHTTMSATSTKASAGASTNSTRPCRPRRVAVLRHGRAPPCRCRRRFRSSLDARPECAEGATPAAAEIEHVVAGRDRQRRDQRVCALLRERCIELEAGMREPAKVVTHGLLPRLPIAAWPCGRAELTLLEPPAPVAADLAGPVMRASEPSSSTSCTGTIASAARDDSASSTGATPVRRECTRPACRCRGSRCRRPGGRGGSRAGAGCPPARRMPRAGSPSPGSRARRAAPWTSGVIRPRSSTITGSAPSSCSAPGRRPPPGRRPVAVAGRLPAGTVQ